MDTYERNTMRSRQATSTQPKRTPKGYDPIVIIPKGKRVAALAALYKAAIDDKSIGVPDHLLHHCLDKGRHFVDFVPSQRTDIHPAVEIHVLFDQEKVNLRSYDKLYGLNAGRKALTKAGVLDVAPPVVHGKLNG